MKSRLFLVSIVITLMFGLAPAFAGMPRPASDEIDVRSYGANGVDQLDDTAAFEAAAAAAAGRTLFIPKGVFLVEQVKVRAGTHVRCSGRDAVLRMKSGSTLTGALTVHHEPDQDLHGVRISGCSFDGNRANNTGEKSAIELVGGDVEVVDQFVIDDNYFHDWSNCAIQAVGRVRDGVVRSNTIERMEGNAIQFNENSHERIVIDGNFISAAEPGSGAGGIEIDNGAHDITIVNNVLRDTAEQAIQVEDGSYNVRIVANAVFGTGGQDQSCIFVAGQQEPGTRSRNVVVANNHVEGCSGDGISVARTDAATVVGNIALASRRSGINVGACEHCSVQANVAWDNGTAGALADGGINSTGSEYTAFVGNVGFDSRSEGARTQRYGVRHGSGDFNMLVANVGHNNTASDFGFTATQSVATLRVAANGFDPADSSAGEMRLDSELHSDLHMNGSRLVLSQEQLLVVDVNGAGDVTGGNLFRTFNTLPTVVNDFDEGLPGQQIMVVFRDSNTTVDFSGSVLHGNDGVDWQPEFSDHMTCVRTTEAWYCQVSHS